LTLKFKLLPTTAVRNALRDTAHSQTLVKHINVDIQNSQGRDSTVENALDIRIELTNIF